MWKWWLGVGALFTMGAIGALVLATSGSHHKETTAPKPLPVPQAAQRVARQFVLTAVQRKHLARSYYLAHPKLRCGFTLAHWESGDIPVIPIPHVTSISFKTDFVRPESVQLELLVYGKRFRPAQFLMILEKYLRKQRPRWGVSGFFPLAGGPGVNVGCGGDP